VTPAPTRIAVIGCGFYAQNHLQSWRDLASEGAVLCAVCDIDAAKAQAAGAAFGVPWFTETGQMLTAAQPDLVDVVTRADSHRPLAELAMHHARGVIVQKPFAPTFADAEAMVLAAQTAGVWLAVHENFRWQPPLRRAIGMVDQGLIGPPSFARIHFRTGYDVYATQPYFLTERQLCIADVGVHLLDLARRLLGEVLHLSCETQQRNPRLVGEDTATIMLRHRSGAVSVVEASYESRRLPDPFPETMMEIEGPDGAIAVTLGGRIELTRKGHMRRSRTPYDFRPWMADPRWAVSQAGAFECCRHLLAMFRAGTPAESSGSDNLATAALVEAAYTAAVTRRAISPEVC
jgi:predicted dehydrogenase